ncbi:IclR family transcriptional regulator [Bordetella sp. BOR01]|uniref:IclR family transcriptional regulator n=1 Tax=Bordetella sp. BOR01 TaxID=2854779 RepID=UPI001C48D9BD|nr:IclR family transcriptional regulator [Bordetella sp. BOR01]MBV7486537.1 IclR family transcriptional regulator [Bordetella sp. BOR01]
MNNTLVKGIAVLELLAHSSRPLRLTHIAAELGIAKSNVHRLMQALVEMRYVLRDEESSTYSASIKLWELGTAVLGKLDLRRHAEQQMNALQDETGETVHLSVLDRNQVVYVHKVESMNPVRAYTQIGGRVPAYCVATGKAQLAYRSESMLAEMSGRLEGHTPNTIVDPARFLREMKKARAQGFAVNRGEWRDNVWGIAAPIMGAKGAAIAAVGISGPADRIRKKHLQDSAALVAAAAAAISEALGSVAQLDALLNLGRRAA